MAQLALRRVLTAIPILLVVSFVVFAMVALIPGDPAAVLAGENATPEQIAEVRASLGLDDPLLVRYWDWLWSALHGDLGQSLRTGQSVGEILGSHVTITLSLVLVTLVIATLLGLAAGIVAAARAGGLLDRALTGLSAVAVALPPFWVSLLLVLFFAVNVRLFPAVGYVSLTESPSQWLSHLFLPALALAALPAAELALQLKDTLTAELRRDYVLTAMAKGLSKPKILFKHTLRNAAIPVTTVLGYRTAQLIGGTVTVEVVFVIPGLGSTAVSSVQARDVTVLLGLVVLTTLAVVVINLLVDISYGYLNPKVRS
ncbi:ABC transporter permease [Phytohabitans sp. ZYX-F-186]|uniref:ABC transporter permease n=1 Tax=Phytohabitans maris TaxID=3071409 RepID=A0ABU0ZZ82_9ACTN|nr:ABC transporter permease [Phytohabitans sp. ZYX-F-186]MDQ7911272.1 ABC transporter permease [Phytohabitans sp. ZYX-F-186]